MSLPWGSPSLCPEHRDTSRTPSLPMFLCALTIGIVVFTLMQTSTLSTKPPYQPMVLIFISSFWYLRWGLTLAPEYPRSLHVAQFGIELRKILLPQSSKFWDYKSELPCLDSTCLRDKSGSSRPGGLWPRHWDALLSLHKTWITPWYLADSQRKIAKNNYYFPSALLVNISRSWVLLSMWRVSVERKTSAM